MSLFDNEGIVVEGPNMEILFNLIKDYKTYPLIIEDADTGWPIDIIHVNIDEKGRIVLSGRYEEMDSKG